MPDVAVRSAPQGMCDKLIFDEVASKCTQQIKSFRKSDTGTTNYLVNFQNKTPCADRVLLDCLNDPTCGTEP